MRVFLYTGNSNIPEEIELDTPPKDVILWEGRIYLFDGKCSYQQVAPYLLQVERMRCGICEIWKEGRDLGTDICEECETEAAWRKYD